MVSVSSSALDSLRRGFAGELLTPGAAGYDDARSLWNGDIDRRPALIACCRGVIDVINSVKFARTHELLVAVRVGAHNVPVALLGIVNQDLRLRRQRWPRGAPCFAGARSSSQSDSDILIAVRPHV